ncbi:hypothetical protein GUJ93_ZPchr0010g10061 [Zizania palustris]|uniref:Uncharacterized protein n=1 Tax=Zizania palustris TaxID=103762 RepID=A0A8J5WC10_ZIZPA|nr:hypothetical protein GUJ93_ZPchr0010g10061 [Zizania palustris]
MATTDQTPWMAVCSPHSHALMLRLTWDNRRALSSMCCHAWRWWCLLHVHFDMAALGEASAKLSLSKAKFLSDILLSVSSQPCHLLHDLLPCLHSNHAACLQA